MLKRCKSKRHNGYKIALSSNDDKRMQSIDSIETYAYGASKDVVSEKEEIKCNNNKTIQKMINFDDVVKENTKKQSKLPTNS